METLLSITGLLKDIRSGITIIVGVSTLRSAPSNHGNATRQLILSLREREEVFTKIIDPFLNHRDHSDIPGIVFRKNGSLCDNESINIVEDLDRIPSPHLTGIIDLGKESIRRHVSIETYRGCPFLLQLL